MTLLLPILHNDLAVTNLGYGLADTNLGNDLAATNLGNDLAVINLGNDLAATNLSIHKSAFSQVEYLMVILVNNDTYQELSQVR